MANMDYPGPCPNCSGIDGCATEAQRQEGIKHYCKGVEMELNSWKARLYDVLVGAEGLKSGDMAEVDDALNLIKSTVKELEAVKERLETECPTGMAGLESNIGQKFEDLRVNYTKALGVISPGWFGG